MTELQPVVLGIVQGLTEFLPISSSGHLVLVPELLGWDLQSVAFDVGLHLGTAIAVIIYFSSDWWNMTKSLFIDYLRIIKSKKLFDQNVLRRESKLLLYILIGTIPVGIAGLALEKSAENYFRSPLFIAIMMIGVAFIMLISDLRALTKTDDPSKEFFKNILLISLSQILALIPGTSRSGITMSTALFLGFARHQAARISFLLATPIIVAAAIFKLPDVLALSQQEIMDVVIGMATSFIVGILVIKWLLNFLKRHSLKWFIVYRVILGLFIIWFFYIR